MVRAQSMQQEPVVVGGAATYSVTSDTAIRTVNQSTEKVVLDWQDLSVLPRETLQFVQPSASSIALNRVMGTGRTEISGLLSANGQVWILNSNGIFISSSGVVRTRGFMASTASASADQFMSANGVYSFQGGSGATIENNGQIISQDGGYAILNGSQIYNRSTMNGGGMIKARLGSVVLGAGEAFTIALDDEGLLSFVIDERTALYSILNSGAIHTDGGSVLITADLADAAVGGVINSTGLLQAQTVSNTNGIISLDGGPKGQVIVGGEINLGGTDELDRGGDISIRGAEIFVDPEASVTLTGPAGNGALHLVDTSIVPVLETVSALSSDELNTSATSQTDPCIDDPSLCETSIDPVADEEVLLTETVLEDGSIETDATSPSSERDPCIDDPSLCETSIDPGSPSSESDGSDTGFISCVDTPEFCSETDGPTPEECLDNPELCFVDGPTPEECLDNPELCIVDGPTPEECLDNPELCFVDEPPPLEDCISNPELCEDVLDKLPPEEEMLVDFLIDDGAEEVVAEVSSTVTNVANVADQADVDVELDVPDLPPPPEALPPPPPIEDAKFEMDADFEVDSDFNDSFDSDFDDAFAFEDGSVTTNEPMALDSELNSSPSDLPPPNSQADQAAAQPASPNDGGPSRKADISPPEDSTSSNGESAPPATEGGPAPEGDAPPADEGGPAPEGDPASEQAAAGPKAEGTASVASKTKSADTSSASNQSPSISPPAKVKSVEVVEVVAQKADPLPPSPVPSEPDPTPQDAEDASDPALAVLEDNPSEGTAVETSGSTQATQVMSPHISVEFKLPRATRDVRASPSKFSIVGGIGL